MNSRRLMLMAGALVFAVICAMMARSLFGGAAAPSAAAAPLPPAGPEVLVATRTLAPGTIITADAFRYQPWPNELVEKAYYIRGSSAGAAALNGTVVRFPIPAGQPLTQGALVKPGDRGFLAAALGPGMRAITISVSAQAGVAGFVFPGDRVDLLLASTMSGADGQPFKSAETIIRNLRVLATDQRTDKTVDDTGKTVVATFANVTIEATPKIAEKIAVAQTLGTLSLALRPIADDKMELERQIAAGEIDVPDGADPKVEKQILLQVAARPIDSDTSVTTGGEVSRFARRGMPAMGTGPVQPSIAAAAPVAAPSPAPAAGSAPVMRGPSVVITRGSTTTRVALPERI